jgi:uridine kinase
MMQANRCEVEINAILSAWKERRGSGILALDGMCGSGKTTLSERISERTGFSVIHMDDYYLPFSQRKKNWREIPAGNMDLIRLKKEVITPFQNHQWIQTRRYLCRSEQYIEEIIPPADGLIVEGTYSCHPVLKDAYTMCVFLEISEKIQRKRILEREGKRSSNFFKIWIPMETNYFQTLAVRSHMDLCLNTESGETEDDEK